MKKWVFILIIILVVVVFFSFIKPKMTQKDKNINAFLKLLQFSEGTYKNINPYAVTFGNSYVIKDFSDHPANLGTWGGKQLSNNLCSGAGQSYGCVSTAAGAYQIIKGTWNTVKKNIPGITFNKEGQDRAAIYLIKKKNALEDVEAGKLHTAISKLNKTWASLPDSPYGQPTKKMSELEEVYKNNGGIII